MPTKLLYLDEPELSEADGVVVRAEFGFDGTVIVVLDQTIFYPQGGGQPADRGRIDSVGGATEVVKVSFADGEVLHHTRPEDFVPTAGERVILHVDPDLRALHSRLHTGGHLVMTAVDKLLGLPATKGYHFPDGPYVEFDGVVPTEDRESVVDRVQDELDRLVAEDSPVTWRFDTVQNLRSSGVHIPAEIPDGKPTRVVITAGYQSPCGGTHVLRLGALTGLRAKQVRFKSGRTRVTYDFT